MPKPFLKLERDGIIDTLRHVSGVSD